MKIILPILFLLTSPWTLAQSLQDDAQAILKIRMQMKPTTEFSKWLTDQWTFATVHCLNQAKLPIPEELNRAPISTNGSFTFPDNSQEFCRVMAQKKTGPQCFALKSNQPPFIFPPAGMPRNYLYLKEVIAKNSEVTVGGECLLVENELVSKQFFAGKAKVIWSMKPTQRSLRTSKGEMTVNMGTIQFEVEGMREKSLPVSVIILDK